MKFSRCRRTAVSACVVACALIAPTAASAESTGVLSPELEQLATPALQSQTAPAQADALGFPASGPGSLEREGRDVTVEISFEGGAVAALPALREAGAEIVASSDPYQLVTAEVAPADLPSLAKIPGVLAVEAVRAPVFYAPESTPRVEGLAICEGGTTLSEGIDQLGVVTQPNNIGLREAFNARGAGQTVGVLSDSFNVATVTEGEEPQPIPTHAAEDMQSDNLPGPENNCSGQQTPVNVLEEGPAGGHDEGRAMLQIVHDIAPHASLAFATAEGGELVFARNIERLAAPVAAGGAGANVIVDDVGYFEEPMFQDGPIATAIAKVTAQGVTYLSAAGNDNISSNGLPNGPEIGSWETPAFTDTETPAECPIPVGVAARHCLDFNPGAAEDDTFRVTIEKGRPITIAVGWSEPWYGVSADLDAYLLRYVDEPKVPKEMEVVSGDNRGNVKGKPAAYVEWQNPEPPKTNGEPEEVFLVVNRCFGNVCDQAASTTAKPRVKLILLQNGSPILGTEYEASEGGNVVGPTIYGHAGAAATVAIGSSKFSTDGVHINATGTPEVHSSRGPVTHYWGPVVSSTPAAALATPEVLEKPDVIATDCGANDFFGVYFLGFWRFCGTSAAAPHAAAVVALMRQTSPTQTPTGLRTALTGSAKAVSGYGPNAVGKGLIRARQAVEALSPRVTVNDPASTLVAPIPPAPPAPPEEGGVVPAPTPGPAPAPSPGPGSGAAGGEARLESKESEKGKAVRTMPTTTIKSHPPKLVKTPVGRPKLKFSFASDQKGAKFECSVDESKWSPCAANYKAPFTLGPHELQVRARMSDGAVDKSPAVFKFKVKLVA